MKFPGWKIIEQLYYSLSKSPRIIYWKELEKTQYLSDGQLRRIQWSRFTDMMQFAYKYNRFYYKRFSSIGIRPEDIVTPEDVLRIPVLTKQDIRENMNDIISDGFCRDDLMRFKTGGSTGTSLELYITEECSECRNACARRHDRWSGWEPGETIGAVWGNPILPSDYVSRMKNWLLRPMIYLDTMNVTDAAVKEFVKDWGKEKPSLLFGHAHSLYILAQYVHRLGIETIRPKGIISTSMMLLPHERKLIEEVFSIKVTDRYGCEEVSLIASECEHHDGMHMNIEHLFIEFINDEGNPVKPGEMGKIIVTDLMNRAMPFIRYQVEDMGIPSQRECPCGRGLPLMEKVVGRTADFLLRRDGSRVAGISLIENTLTKIPGIGQMQIIQKALDVLYINIVIKQDYSTRSKIQLEEYFMKIFGEGVKIEIFTVHHIAPESSGKYRFSICEVSQHQRTDPDI